MWGERTVWQTIGLDVVMGAMYLVRGCSDGCHVPGEGRGPCLPASVLYLVYLCIDVCLCPILQVLVHSLSAVLHCWYAC